MNPPAHESVWLIAPYAVWMLALAAFPATAGGYALRVAVTLPVLAAALCRLAAIAPGRRLRPRAGEWAWGAAVGLAALAIWIAPENCAWYRHWCVLGGGAGATAMAGGSAWQLAVRLFGSAAVIAVAEELFFRRWLLRFAGFGWMVLLFAVEHDRWLVAAVVGALYGVLALRRGLRPAVIAHAVTNLGLGIWVLATSSWELW